MLLARALDGSERFELVASVSLMMLLIEQVDHYPRTCVRVHEMVGATRRTSVSASWWICVMRAS